MRLATLLLITLLTACTGTQSGGGEIVLRTAIEIGTIRLIDESDEIGSDDVLSAIADIRERVTLDGTITSDELMVAAQAAIDFSRLTPYERVLLSRILTLAEQRLSTYDNLESVSATADQILTWVEGIAGLSTD